MIDFSAFHEKKIAIVGLGYIGQNLLEYLLQNTVDFDVNIIPFGRYDVKEIGNFGFDFVFNCAGNSGDFRQKLSETIESNLNLTLFLLQNMKPNSKYIMLSSTRIYGFSESETIIFEENFASTDKHLNLEYIYDGTKKLTESLVVNFGNQLCINTSIIRLSNVYGKFRSLDDSTLIKKIVRFKKENKLIELTKNQAFSKKDFIFIDDALVGISLAALHGKSGEAYNIASGQSVSVYEICKRIGLEMNILNDDSIPKHSLISIKKAKADLNFKPIFDLEFSNLLH
jgi:nucleoside-diphosphate-sugar epimerase